MPLRGSLGNVLSGCSMGRTASLVLLSPAGELLGMFPPLELELPYWQESADLVAEVEARFSVRVVVLRLLHGNQPHSGGGEVAYLGELSAGTPGRLLPVPESLVELARGENAKRMPWAELGGPARSLDWARAALGWSELSAVQQRTWNLSTLWRLERSTFPEAPVWLKQVPAFMSYEGRVLRWLNRAAPSAAPTLLAGDDEGRSLLAHVEGEDLYGAPAAMRELILRQSQVIQSLGAAAVDELLLLGVPDLRGEKRAEDVSRKLLAWSRDYPRLEDLLRYHEQQLERLEECGLPATLVHSDNHPGNARGSVHGVRLLDWGESFVGNPVTDICGLLAGLSEAEAAPLLASWCASWKRLAPRSQPERALELAPFIAAMRGAATYAYFLQEIEPSEWPYHFDDVPRCLQAAEALWRARL
ncbi:MAG: aminoglycoside phosphotransferase family protein [Myxococcales bacterium]|nr:MAG: aminoglycoside phosphotransferase family protein [Myxococcales bacterium]